MVVAESRVVGHSREGAEGTWFWPASATHSQGDLGHTPIPGKYAGGCTAPVGRRDRCRAPGLILDSNWG